MKKFDKLGWIVAAALAGGMVGMGFQTPAAKFGTVDIEKVFTGSDAFKAANELLKNYQVSRHNALEFVNQNQGMKPADAEKFIALTIKEKPAPEDKTELDRITKDALADTGKQSNLVTKQAPTDADKALLNEYATRTRQNRDILEKYSNQWESEAREKQATLRADALAKVRASVQNVGKSQGYTIVFAQESAPYAANDLTADALKAVTKDK